MFKPLSKEVTLKWEGVTGLTLYSTREIKKGFEFGVSHIRDERFDNGWIRTTLGAFLNYNEKPNSILKYYNEDECLQLVAIKDIKENTELSVGFFPIPKYCDETLNEFKQGILPDDSILIGSGSIFSKQNTEDSND